MITRRILGSVPARARRGTQRRSRSVASGLLLVASLWLATGAGIAADDPGEAVRRQEAEVERLEQELEQARAKLERLRQEATAAHKAETALPATPAEPPAGMATNPPPAWTDGEVISAKDLAALFAADPAAATQRFDERMVRVEGEVEGFATPMFVRIYEVRLAGPERALGVLCRFNYVDRYRAVFTRDSGRSLVGRINDRTAQPLYRVGDKVVILGRCKGVKDGLVILGGATRVR